MGKSYAVLGLGKFGKSVALNLMKDGAEVLAVDQKEELVRDIVDYVTCAVCADVTDMEVMNSIGLEASVMALMIAKEIGVPYILAKADGRLKGEILKRIGADEVVYPEEEMGARTAYNLVSGKVMDLFDLSSKTSIVEIHLKKGWVGKNLRQLDIRGKYNINVVAIHSGEDFNGAPDPDQILNERDSLIVIGNKEDLIKLR